MKKKILAAGLIIVVGLVVAFWFRGPKDDVIEVPDDDPAMQAAIAEAQRAVPDLLTAIDEGVDYYAVKVPITDANGTEHFWLSGVQYRQGTFTGRIDNEPNTVETVKPGQSYSAGAHEISDWLYMRNGVVTGNRTLRVLFPRMSAADVFEAKQAMGWP